MKCGFSRSAWTSGPNASPDARAGYPIVDRAVVASILAAHAPVGSSVTVFGSRARGSARRASDLDLAIDAGRRLRLEEEAALAAAFEESDLPDAVDLVDLHAVSDRFAELVRRDGIPFTTSSLQTTAESDAEPTPLAREIFSRTRVQCHRADTLLCYAATNPRETRMPSVGGPSEG